MSDLLEDPDGAPYPEAVQVFVRMMDQYAIDIREPLVDALESVACPYPSVTEELRGVTDEVDRVAQAMRVEFSAYNVDRGRPPLSKTWEEIDDRRREKWRRMAKVSIEASDHRCDYDCDTCSWDGD